MRDDEGSASLLTIGLVAVLLAVILTVAAATQVHLQGLRLQHIADEVALAAADALDLGGYYATGGAAGARVDAARVEDEAYAQLRASSTRQGLTGVTLTGIDTPGDRVEVRVATTTPVLFGVEWLPGRVSLAATASATANLG